MKDGTTIIAGFVSFCSCILFIIGTVCLAASYTVSETQGQDTQAEYDAMQNSRSATCELGGALLSKSCKHIAEAKCNSCGSCSLGSSGSEADRNACPKSGNTQLCCNQWQASLICDCEVAIETSISASSDVSAYIVTSETYDLNINRTAFCNSALASSPYTRVRTSGPDSFQWQCGLVGKPSVGLGVPVNDAIACGKGIVPQAPMDCLVDAQGGVRIGSRQVLQNELEQKQNRIDDNVMFYRISGITLISITVCMCLAVGSRTAYLGIVKGEGPCSSLEDPCKDRCDDLCCQPGGMCYPCCWLVNLEVRRTSIEHAQLAQNVGKPNS